MPHIPSEPFQFTSGPRSGVKLAIVGEVWGEQENLTGRPFAGSSGQELTNLLQQVGIARRECFLTTVFPVQPVDGKAENLCGKKAEVGGEGYTFPPFAQGKYIFPEYLPEVARLKAELTVVQPNLILAMGNAACWALLGHSRITTIRGVTAQSEEGWKVLPTFSPSHVLRAWDVRPIVLQDLGKALREMEFPEIRRPERVVLVDPTLEEIAQYVQEPHPVLSVDIETTKGQIASIGFASTKKFAIVVPFITDTEPPRSHWKTTVEEVSAWRMVKALLETKTPKLFQNGLYDLQYILRMGIRPWNCTHDTMLLHHSMFPELRKGLGFLGSIYTDEGSWKLLGKRKRDSEKREE